MKKLWGDSGISVILLPSGQQGNALLDIAKSWTELRLLGPAIWITPELIQDPSKNPPLQAGLVMGLDKTGELSVHQVDLFRALAKYSVKKLRLVSVRPVSDSVDFDDKQDQLISTISNYLAVSRPQLGKANPGASDSASFIKLCLITNPTEFKNASARKFGSGQFNGIFVASPEDRSSPLAGDGFVRHLAGERQFDGFTMMHLATIAGLWLGLPNGSYEIDGQEGWLENKATISRVFVSAILTDGLARRASTHVLEKAADAENGFVDFGMDMPVEGTYPIPDGQVDDYIRSAVELTFSFENGALAYKPQPAPELPDPYKRGVLGFLGEFFKFSGGRLARIPVYAGIYLYRGFVRALNTIFQGGKDGLFRVNEPEEQLDKNDQNLMAQRDQVFAEKERADAAIRSPFIPSQVRSTPALWTSIRKLTFGLLDGSNLGQFGYQRGENGWPIFYRVSSMFHDPANVLTVSQGDGSGQTELDWSSVSKAQNLLQTVTSDLESKASKRAKIAGKSEEIELEIAEITAKRRELQDLLEDILETEGTNR